MADVEYSQNPGAQPVNPAGGSSAGGVTNLIGAALSLALVIGVSVWGYKLLVRDVSGVPVVRALEGPMRVQPDNPGGQPADHQGLAVNAVAADGVAEAPADRLVLAPRAVTLSDEDTPQSDLKIRAALAPEPDASPDLEAVAAAAQAGSVEALVAELTKGVTPLSKVQQPDVAQDLSETSPIVQPEPLVPATSLAASAPKVSRSQDEPKPQPAVFTGPGLKQSPRPRTRPADGAAAVVIPASVDVFASTELDIDPDTIPPGTRLVQLGAYDSSDVAKSEWDRLNARFGDYLTGKSRVVQRASSGGRVFFRLRAMGFDDLSDARRFCSALVSEGSDCIPVVTR
jgi:hypothetical protein